MISKIYDPPVQLARTAEELRWMEYIARKLGRAGVKIEGSYTPIFAGSAAMVISNVSGLFTYIYEEESLFVDINFSTVLDTSGTGDPYLTISLPEGLEADASYTPSFIGFGLLTDVTESMVTARILSGTQMLVRPIPAANWNLSTGMTLEINGRYKRSID